MSEGFVHEWANMSKESVVKGIPYWLLRDIVDNMKNKRPQERKSQHVEKLESSALKAKITPTYMTEHCKRTYKNWGTEISNAGEKQKRDYRRDKIMKSLKSIETAVPITSRSLEQQVGLPKKKQQKPTSPKESKSSRLQSVPSVRRSSNRLKYSAVEPQKDRCLHEMADPVSIENGPETISVADKPTESDIVATEEDKEITTQSLSFAQQTIEAKKKMIAFVRMSSFLSNIAIHLKLLRHRRNRYAKNIQRRYREYRKEVLRKSLKDLIVLPLSFVLYRRHKRRMDSADVLTQFLKDQLEMGMYRRVIKKFISKIKICQRAVKTFVFFNKLRVQTLEKIWDGMEKDIRRQVEDADIAHAERVKRNLQRRLLSGDSGVHGRWALVNAQIESYTVNKINKVATQFRMTQREEEVLTRGLRERLSPERHRRSPSPPQYPFSSGRMVGVGSPSDKLPFATAAISPILAAFEAGVHNRGAAGSNVVKDMSDGNVVLDRIDPKERQDIIRKHLRLKRRAFHARLMEKFGISAGRRIVSVVTEDLARMLLMETQTVEVEDRYERVDAVIEAQLGHCLDMSKNLSRSMPGTAKPMRKDAKDTRKPEAGMLFLPFTDPDLGKSWKSIIEEVVKNDIQEKKAILQGGQLKRPATIGGAFGSAAVDSEAIPHDHILLRPDLGGRYLRTAGGTVYNLYSKGRSIKPVPPSHRRGVTR